RDELGGEAVQAVGEGRGGAGQAQGEQLAVGDVGQGRKLVDLHEVQRVEGLGPAGHDRTTMLSRINPSRPRSSLRCCGATVRWRTGTTAAASNPAASPRRAISSSLGM